MKNDYNYTAELAAVSKRFDETGQGRYVLQDVSLTVKPGSVTLLLGPSGSGKTTLLTIMAGLQGPTSGVARLFGRDVREYSKKELQLLRARSIGFIFQTFKLVDSLTVMQNLLMVGSFAKRPIKEANEKAHFYLEQSGVAHLSSAWPAILSQGEKQRVAVARALVNGAELIIADEPTGSLSSDQGMAIIRYLKHIADTEQRTIVIASHDQRIKEYSNNVIQLSDGKLGMI